MLRSLRRAVAHTRIAAAIAMRVVMAIAVAMHEQMHEWIRKQNQIWRDSQRMVELFAKKEKRADHANHDRHTLPGSGGEGGFDYLMRRMAGMVLNDYSLTVNF